MKEPTGGESMNIKRACSGLITLALVLLTGGPADANRPLAGRSLRVEPTEGGSRSLVVLKSAKTTALATTDPLPDPRIQETSILVRWSGGAPVREGRTERILLDPTKWSALGQPAGSRGWRYHDPSATRGGIRSISLRQTARSGSLRWTARGPGWDWPMTGPLASMDLDLQIGDQRLCSSFEADTAETRINTTAGRLSARAMPGPAQCGSAVCGNGLVEGPESCDDGNLSETDLCSNDCLREQGPSPEDPAPGTTLLFENNRLHLVGPSTALQPGRLEIEPGTAGRFDRLPLGPTALVYEADMLTASHAPDLGPSSLWVYLDGSTTNGIYAQARILFDFEDDGIVDREELFTAAPAHANRGLDLYDSPRFPRLTAIGAYRDLENGRIRIEFRNPLMPPREGPEIRTGEPVSSHAASHIRVPFVFSEIERTVEDTPPLPALYPESILCPAEGDARCAAAVAEGTGGILPPEARRLAREAGLDAFRFQGNHGSCAGCHVPDGFDLAIIGYRDEDIRRRALEHVSAEKSEAIVELVRIQREEHALTQLLHPAKFRPLQPGFAALPGNTPRERDFAFLRHLAEEQSLILLTDVIDSRAKAELAEQQLLALDVHKLQIGVRLDRWSEDTFHGPSHIGQDPDDSAGNTGQSASVAEWLPNLATEPLPDQDEAFYASFDRYAENPTDLAFWRFYDRIRENTGSHETLITPADQRAFTWMQTKYEAIQVMGHMLRRGTLAAPDTTIDQPGGTDEASLATSIARNPFWRVGDLIRQHPLNCNHPDGCTTFPEFVPAESREREQNIQSRILQRAWFWAGWMVDDALLRSEDDFATISGDYFYPLHHGVWNGHYAFITARMSALKANATAKIRPWHHARAGHGKWASIRPFLVFKHSEFQRPMVGKSDPRYFWNQRLMSNLARMWLYLVHADLERSGSAFDREGTAKAMNFVRLNWLDSVDPGGDRAATDRLFSEIVAMLREADELREQHHTDDLYDYLPVDAVVLD